MKKKLLALLMGASMVMAACGGGGDKDSASEVNPEKLYNQKCSGCHGGDLKGGTGPDLSKIGAALSKDEIQKIIEEGKGGMPSGLYKGEEASKVAEWLAEKK